jgi:hypothetical protein
MRFISHPPTLQRLDFYQFPFTGAKRDTTTEGEEDNLTSMRGGDKGFSPLTLRVVGGKRYKLGGLPGF